MCQVLFVSYHPKPTTGPRLQPRPLGTVHVDQPLSLQAEACGRASNAAVTLLRLYGRAFNARWRVDATRSGWCGSGRGARDLFRGPQGEPTAPVCFECHLPLQSLQVTRKMFFAV